MAARFTELVVDCTDINLVAAFWRDALGYEVTSDSEGEIELSGPPGAGPTLLFVPVPERKQVKNRLHIDLSPTDRDRDAEVERLLALGARHVDIGQGDVSWVVLGDPEGNEFCVLRGQVPPLASA
jgi:Glyoxalase-like domain